MRSVLAGLIGLVLLLPATAFAQDRRDRDEDDQRNGANRDRGWDDNRGRDNRSDAREYGARNGYQDGLSQGREDRNRRSGSRDRGNNNGRKNDDNGYQKYMGSKGQYKQGYRDGYQRGYQEGFGNSGGWGGWGDGRQRNDYPNGNGGYNANTLVRSAQENGQRDGAYYGQMDRNNGHSYRPTQVKGYKDADHGYSSSLGSRDDFKRLYRQAFVQGYQSGYGSRSSLGYFR